MKCHWKACKRIWLAHGQVIPLPGVYPREMKTYLCSKTHMWGQAQWLMPIISALWEAEVGRSLELTNSRPAWATWQNPVCTKNTKISWVWWHLPVFPAALEAAVGWLLEPRRQRLQWAEILPLHCSLGDRARPCLKRQFSSWWIVFLVRCFKRSLVH